MPLPYAAHAGRRDGKPAFPQFIGDPNLPECWLIEGKRNNSVDQEPGCATVRRLEEEDWNG